MTTKNLLAALKLARPNGMRWDTIVRVAIDDARAELARDFDDPILAARCDAACEVMDHEDRCWHFYFRSDRHFPRLIATREV